MQSNTVNVDSLNSQIPTQGIDISTNVNTWALPEGAIARFGKGPVNAVAFSPNGNYLAVGTWVGVWWYDVSSWSPIALWETERGAISALDFSPDGRELATGNSDGEIKIWDVQNGACSAKIKRPVQRFGRGGNELGIQKIVFSSNNQYIAASCKCNGIFYIWDTNTGEQFVQLSTNPEVVLKNKRRVSRPICFSSDGHLFAVASPTDTEGTTDFIAVWDMETLEHIASIKDYTTPIDTLVFSPCGNYLAAGDATGTLKEWEVSTGKQTGKQLKVSSEYPRYSQVIPSYTTSGQLRAAGQHGSTIAIWDVESGEKLDAFRYDWYIFSYHFLNGTHLAVHNPFKVWIENSPNKSNTHINHRGIYSIPTFSSDGKTLLSISGGTAVCWNIAKKRFEQGLYNEEKSMRNVYILPNGEMRALGNIRDTNIDIAWDYRSHIFWDVETNETIATFEHRQPVRHFALSPNGECAVSGDGDGTLYVWDKTGNQKVLFGHKRWVKAVAFHPDGEQLVSISWDNTVRLWDVVSGEEIISLPTRRLIYLYI